MASHLNLCMKMNHILSSGFPLPSTTPMCSSTTTCPMIRKNDVKSQPHSCSSISRKDSRTISSRPTKYTFKYPQDAMNYMWYFSILLIVLLISMLIVNQCVHSVNLRPYAMVVFMIFNLAQISLIIYGMSFYAETDNVKENMLTLSGCFVGKERENVRGIWERM